MEYPYIGEVMSSGKRVLFYSSKTGMVVSDDSSSGYFSRVWNERCFKNITREYLNNTYGEVESQEHAEFIAKLGRGCWFNFNKYHEGNKWFCFTEHSLYFFNEEFVANDNKEKKITLPLPPKGEDMKSEEWPQVGDEVAWSPRLSRKGILLNIHEGMAWIKDSYGEFVSIEVNKLKKPTTPEEELREKLKEELSLYISLHDPHDTKIDLADAILDGEINGLSYKPK